MISSQEVNNALYAYRSALNAHESALKKYHVAVDHLAYMRKLLRGGHVKQSVYNSYKATTATFRQTLCDVATHQRAQIHLKWRAYDAIKRDYDKQNESDKILANALRKLSPEEHAILVAHYRNTQPGA